MNVHEWLKTGQHNRVVNIILIIVALVAGGLAAGRLLGSRLLESVILSRTRFPLLLSQPVGQLNNVYALINSGNPFSRLSGYYALREKGMIDQKFVAERFKSEQEPAARRTLAWILSFSEDRSAALKFYASIYAESDDSLKKELLRIMKRLDKEYYRDFIEKNRVEKMLIPE
ncbi:MAG: hypothetical protein JW807_15840 [Spirochaetes bacterium]|nr:hypothetical protein [Spirochaetota bacterium]